MRCLEPLNKVDTKGSIAIILPYLVNTLAMFYPPLNNAQSYNRAALRPALFPKRLCRRVLS